MEIKIGVKVTHYHLVITTLLVNMDHAQLLDQPQLVKLHVTMVLIITKINQLIKLPQYMEYHQELMLSKLN